MGIADLILIAIGLAMDCFAVAICFGVLSKKIRWNLLFRMALLFGGFQAVMPVFGWLAGLSVESLMASIDHWIAFGLLSIIGAKMIIEGIRTKPGDACRQFDKWTVMISLAFATSIDALVVGMSFALLDVHMLPAILAIGIASFLLTIAGAIAGQRFGKLLGKKAEIAGGIVLIAMGVKILAEHLLTH
jgi:manganese efflux pump family protein